MGSVHPRACGEQGRFGVRRSSWTGSSPRLRGTVPAKGDLRHLGRFIPAPAGNSCKPATFIAKLSVHPRACGEQRPLVPHRLDAGGSSPRLRGTVFQPGGVVVLQRFIPAPAGNRTASRIWTLTISVHPRACGEQAIGRIRDRLTTGSSPRLRGTVKIGMEKYGAIRFIPAPAGNRGASEVPLELVAVHPRACGEQLTPLGPTALQIGSSPRLRGTVGSREPHVPLDRFIPAPAGNRGRPGRLRQREPVHPRACGEQTPVRSSNGKIAGSSPRLRGTAVLRLRVAMVPRFIPAPAGNRCHCRTGVVSLSVHPRACGEQPTGPGQRPPTPGSSPRLRGTD